MVFSQLNNFINSLFNPKTLDKEQSRKTSNYTDFLSYHTIASLLPYRIYDNKNDIYINDNSYSFVIELLPIIGGDEQTSNILTQLITDGLPENCYVSFFNWASPNVEAFLDRWSKPRNQIGDLYRKQSLERKKFFMDGVRQSLFSDTPFTIKNFRCFMTATIPFDAVKSKGELLNKLLRFRQTLVGSMKNIGVYNERQLAFTPDKFINLMSEILNPIATTNYENVGYDEFNPINKQITNSENTLFVSKDSLLFEKDDIAVKTLSVKSYPKMWAQWQCSELIGSISSDQLRMTCPFLTCFSFYIENEEKRTTKAKIKQARVTQQSGTSMAKFMPQLFEQKADWDFVLDKLDSGQKLATASYSVIIFDTEENISQSEQTIKSIYKNNGWVLQTDKYIQLATFLSSLPFVLGDRLSNDYFDRLEKGKTMVSWTCANLLPVQGEYKGMNSAVMQLMGRRGQPLYWDPFGNTGGNYNVAVIGKSGSGKSVFMQELVTSLRGTGCRTYVIDDGRSFMNACKLQGGKFVYFAGSQNVCLNPFSLISEKDEADAKTEDINLISNIIKTMCFSARTADDFQISAINNAVLDIIKKNGKSATISDVKEYLSNKKDDRLKDMAIMLGKFSKGGQYDKYFEGECNVELNNDFIAFEMSELKDKKDLQSIVLLVLMFVISKEMYYGDRKQKTALIIDEAWDLLQGGGAVGDFIEGFARRCRKYGGTLITGTQSIEDYYKNSGSMAAINNSDWVCLLAQKPEAIEALKQSKKVIMDETKEDLLKSLRMSSKQYSEVMICNADGYFIGRLILDMYSLAIYSSKAEDVARIEQLQKEGKTLAEAVEISAKLVGGLK
jgi:conjugal transfer ATP-binding protein TraC